MTIIEINAREDGGHGLQSQSGRTECWLEGWIAVPEELEAAAWACRGYCTLTIEEGVLTGLTPTDPPPEPEPTPSLDERVDELETNKADKTEVAAVWDQMAAAYSEGVQEA